MNKLVIKMWSNLKPLEDRLQVTKIGAGGFYSSIRCTLLCSRVIGLFPLSGLSHHSSDKLSFNLRSPYTALYAVSLSGQCLMFFMSFYCLIQKEVSLNNLTNTIFCSLSLVSSIILANIGWFLPRVMARVKDIEADLPPFSRDVSKICNRTSVCIFLAASGIYESPNSRVEHILSLVYGLALAYFCAADNIIESFFRFNMPFIFDYTSFALWKGILIEVFNIQSTFIWSFNDLLLMVNSIYLTEHLITHNNLLKCAVRQNNFSANTFRVQYLSIVHLVKLINRQVGIYIIASFGCNLYFICTQLFYTLNKTRTGHFVACQNRNPKNYETLHGIEHSLYFAYSFSFLMLRTSLVLLLAARIHSNSRGPLVALYSLPSNRFDIEVKRFIEQINNTKVALSCLDFFYVTRTMILTLLGTIVTYELVLLQFSK